MSKKILKPATLAAGAVVLGSFALAQSAFAFSPLAQGYLAGTHAVAADKPAEGSCGADKKAEGSCGGDHKAAEGNCGADKGHAEGRCGEGKCGMARMDANKDGMVSAAEHATAAQSMFAKADANHDGMVDATEMKAAHEGRCGEGKCGAGGKKK
jgi:uncharacterized low-complexity protein